MTLINDILKWCFSLMLCSAFGVVSAQDTTSMAQPQAAPSKPRATQVRIGLDLMKPLLFSFAGDKKAYELSIDYYFKKELYLVAEGGYGHSAYRYTDLSYQSRNAFVRLGFDKSLLPRLLPQDWDMIGIGLRYGVAFINRSEVQYTVSNAVWGASSGTLPAKNNVAHWAEIAGGMRMDLWKRIGAGWTARGKFLINPKAFAELPPAYIAGYGKGDKGTVFDFNLYLTYNLLRKQGR